MRRGPYPDQVFLYEDNVLIVVDILCSPMLFILALCGVNLKGLYDGCYLLLFDTNNIFLDLLEVGGSMDYCEFLPYVVIRTLSGFWSPLAATLSAFLSMFSFKFPA